VLLHSATAVLLSSLAAISDLSAQGLLDFLKAIAPVIGGSGQNVSDLVTGAGLSSALLPLLLDPSPRMRDLLATLDPTARAGLDQAREGFENIRADMRNTVEGQLETAGVGSILPAVNAGLLKLLPFDPQDDVSSAYLEALWEVLRDARQYPLFDERIAGLVDLAVREGKIQPSAKTRSRGKQVGAATQFLARLPTFPMASMDEVVEIRQELDSPLVRFRAEMVSVAESMTSEAFGPDFDEQAEEAWVGRVAPALLELEELVSEKRLRIQFGARLPSSGALGAMGGLVAGITSHAPLIGLGVAAGAAVAQAAASATVQRSKLDREIRKRPYYLLHHTEELLERGE
jgi:hypothetical protein